MKMTNRVKLRPHNYIPYTLVPNFFIDGPLIKANGEFVKVYLVLLRFIAVGQLDFSLGQIADHLTIMESDVLRALSYFQREGLLTLTQYNGQITEIHLSQFPYKDNEPGHFAADHHSEYGLSSDYRDDPPFNQPMNRFNHNPDPFTVDEEYESPRKVTFTPNIKDVPSSHLKVISSKPEYTNKEMAVFAEVEEFSQLLYIIQKYLGKTLTSNEVKTIISFNDWLGLPFEVIELLIEYCADNDHRNMRYIEKVAIDWADSGINTIEKAKVRTETYNRSYFVILKSYGITDRTPTPKQIRLMDKWLNDYQFDMSVIVEACERTIAQINKAEMRYTDSILDAWYKNGVKNLADIKALDQNRPKANYNQSGQTVKSTSSGNKFNSYSQRQYDYDELEKKALELRLKESGGKRYSS